MINHEKYIYSQYQINKLKQWKNYLAENEELLRTRFKLIINRYSIPNRINLPIEEKEIIELELFHGSGDLNFSFNAKTVDGNEINKIHSDYYLVPEFNWNIPLNNDFQYPETLDIYYEDFRESRSETEKWHLTFDWLVSNWIDLGGHKIGIVSGTWQNNAASTFSFNLINWDDCIDLPEPKLNQFIDYPINRKLTEFEIKARVRFTQYHPFIQKFRYFEKNDEFHEIGFYSNILGNRSGKKKNYSEIAFQTKISAYEYRNMRFEQCKIIAIKVDELLNNGFEEKIKPNGGVKLSEDLVEWEYGPFLREFEPFDESTLRKVETSLNFEIPKQYEWFLARMNNIKPVWRITNFRIGHQKWKTFEIIFRLEDLPKIYKEFHNTFEVKKELLPIAKDITGGYVLIDSKSNSVYYFQDHLIYTHNSFQGFILDCTGISKYFYPMKYHLEKENANMLRRWISSGININDESLFGNRKPIRITRNKEIAELLCQHGANPNDAHLFSEMGSSFLMMLIDYGLDINKKLESQAWFKNNILKDDEYIEVRKLIND